MTAALRRLLGLQADSPSKEPDKSHGATTPALYDLLHDEINRRLDRQADNIKQIDGKAALVAGFAATAAQFLASHDAIGWLKVLAEVSYVGAFVFAVSALFVSSYSDAPRPEQLRWQGGDETKAKERIIGTKIKAFENNSVHIECKAIRWMRGVELLGAAIVLSAAAIGAS